MANIIGKMDYTLIFNILATIGGASGVVGLVKWCRNKMSKVKMLYPIGDFHLSDKDLVVHFQAKLVNEKEESVYITDIAAFVAGIPSKTEDGRGYVVCGQPNFSMTKLEAKCTIDIDYEIKFQNIDVHQIDRIGVTHFMGFMGNVPVIMANENDFDEKWDDLPIEMKVYFHINGKDLINATVAAYPNSAGERFSRGTLGGIDIAKLQRDYAMSKKKQVSGRKW
jgi:hypothetical protein